ncbi:response regulator [Permianibacter sp. IMCC34836]|uniref:response regulator n=1 Tax=Permianibacter fluminis TaxID=2738515 RepID=UPI0015534DC2|nr:response regulator [Permianibacter fluminis]NQD35655.1 response regulator [Permianibacter fluminis]
MSVALLICDDSGMARKQLLRALPPDWELNITQAANGLEGITAIRAGKGELVLLDLTMPEMDGYEVLKAVRDEGHQCQIIVVSGDVQEQAVNRVMALGALTFLQKPVDALDLRKALRDPYLQLRSGTAPKAAPAPTESAAPATAAPPEPATTVSNISALAEVSVPFRDAFREINNVAMGRAAALLAKVLGVFVKLPIPNVNLLEVGELHMALADVQRGGTVSSVCQGYISGGISGEALLIFHDSSYRDIAKLMKHDGALDANTELELLMDLGSVLIGACLNGIAEQLDIRFSQGHPVVLGRHCAIDDLIRVNQTRWKNTLAVEISYGIEHHDVHFDLLLLFTEDSVARLTDKMGYLMS